MSAGVTRILIGVVLLAIGIGATMASSQRVFIGAILVGIIQLVRGLVLLASDKPK